MIVYVLYVCVCNLTPGCHSCWGLGRWRFSDQRSAAPLQPWWFAGLSWENKKNTWALFIKMYVYSLFFYVYFFLFFTVLWCIKFDWKGHFPHIISHVFIRFLWHLKISFISVFFEAVKLLNFGKAVTNQLWILSNDAAHVSSTGMSLVQP